MSESIRASVVGGSGYAGGELLRLLLRHPQVVIQQATSERFQGKPVTLVHPHLRGETQLRFCALEDIEPCDLIFTGLPHGRAMEVMPELLPLAPRLIDLSADFRLGTSEVYERWYGHPHSHPELLDQFICGIAEINRSEIVGASHVAGAGCNATAVILALYPLFKERLAAADRTVVEAKVGSSESGNAASEGSHHPVRAGCVRSFRPVGHRHTAEILEALACGREIAVHFSATAIEMVRGVLVTCHVFPDEPLSERDLWRLYRRYYGEEPFIRLINAQHGAYRLPEPKLVRGTNHCDIGFKVDPESGRVVVIAAIDNLMKGAAGQAVQAMNLMLGCEEKTGLDFIGMHP